VTLARGLQTRMLIATWTALLLAWLTAGCAGLALPPTTPVPVPTDPGSTPAPRATVAVQVLDADTRAAVEGAVVDISVTPSLDDGRTDALGYWALEIEQGSWVIEVRAPGYREAVLGGHLTANTHTEVLLNREGAMAGLGGAPWPGQLRVSSGGFKDGQGQWVLPLCAHFGEAFSAYTRGKTVEGLTVEAQLQLIKSAGYDCVRFWDNLGEYSGAWRGREVSPFNWTNGDGVSVSSTPSYYDRLRSFLMQLRVIGLTADHSRGDLGRSSSNFPTSRVVDHAESVAALYDQLGWDLLAIAEGNNEDWQNGNFGPANLLRIVEPFKRRGAIVGLSCPPDSSEHVHDLNEYSVGASVYVVHGYRSGESNDRIRHIFSIKYEGRPTVGVGWQTEPTGPGAGVTVGRVDDPEELGLLAAQSWAAGQAWNYMSSHGVFWDGAIHTQPGFYTVPKVRALLYAFAPDLMTWDLRHGGHADAPLRSATGYWGDAGVTRGVARINIARSGDRFVAVVTGGRGEKTLTNRAGCPLSLTLVQPTADGVSTHSFTLDVDASFNIDYRVGRIVLGQCQR
jgi:hypothetical protein